MEHRHSHGSFNVIRPTIETVPAKGFTVIPIAELFSPASAHEHSAAGTDLGHLLVDENVGADISVLRASTTSPSMISGEKLCISPQPLGHRVS